MDAAVDHRYLILRREEHAVLGQEQFGMPGLLAVESIGPFTGVQASGPLITVHDSVVDAGLGIGHHPHRFNERLFFIEQGELDHDDAQNGIKGHMEAGDVGEFTEGRRGMMHSEWNHGDVDCQAYILVYTTDPVPEETSFSVLRDADAPRYEEGSGARTKELVGPRSPLEVHGDVRLIAETRLETGAELVVSCADGEGGLVNMREGAVSVDDDEALAERDTLLVPPGEGERFVRIRATVPSRLVRVVHGPGHGFVVTQPIAARLGLSFGER